MPRVESQLVESLDGQIVDGVPVLKPAWTCDLGDYVVALSATKALSAAITGAGELLLVTSDGTITQRVAAHRGGAQCLELSQNGEWVVTGGQDGFVRLWDCRSAKLVWESSHWSSLGAGGTPCWVDGVHFSPNGRRIVAHAGKSVVVFDTEGALLVTLPAAPATVSSVTWDRTDDWLLAAAYGGVWRHKLGEVGAKKHYGWKMAPTALALSPDSKWIATGSQDCTVHVWNAKTGEDLAMSGYPQKIKELAWSPDSRLLATGGGQVVTVWSFSGKGPAGSDPIVGQGHVEAISQLAFNGDGKWLGSVGKDGAVFFWKVGRTLEAKALGLRGVSCTAAQWQSNQFVTGYATGHLIAWNSPE